MSVRRQSPKRDSNERGIIEALKAVGCSVQQLSARGVPDLLVGIDINNSLKINLLMEIKSKTGKLTPDEDKWITTWKGQVAVVKTEEQALEIISNLLRSPLVPRSEQQQHLRLPSGIKKIPAKQKKREVRLVGQDSVPSGLPSARRDSNQGELSQEPVVALPDLLGV